MLYFFPPSQICEDLHSAGCLVTVLSYILHKSILLNAESSRRWRLLNCHGCSLWSPLVCIKPVFQLAADVWRPGSCRHLAVVCHISLRVTGPETEREAATSLRHGHGHIATMCFVFFFFLHPSGDDTNGGTYVRKICAVKDFECPMRPRKHGAVWEARVNQRSGMSFRSFCVLIFEGHSLTTLWCWCKNKY